MTSWVALHAAGEVDEGARDVVADDLVVAAAELSRPARAAQPSAAGIAPRAARPALVTCTASSSPPPERAAIRAPRRSRVSPSGPPVRATTTRSRASHGAVDAVLGAVGLQRGVHLVGEPEQRELAQRGQVAEPEVVRQGRVDPRRPGRPARRRAGRAAPAGRGRRARSGRRRAARRRGSSPAAAIPVICSTTSLSDSMCWMLTVESTSMPASSRASHVLPALRVREPGRVRVGELVDEGDVRMPREHARRGPSRERHAAVLDGPARHHLEAVEQRGGRGALVGLDDRDDDILARGLRAAGPPRAWRRSCRRRERRRA